MIKFASKSFAINLLAEIGILKNSFLALLFILFFSAAGAFSQGVVSPTPSPAPSPSVKPEDEEIRIDTELVNINVRVVDRNNRPINTLQKGDFQVLEDGVPQKIEFFSKAEVPTEYTLVVDNSGSLRRQIEEVIDAGKTMISANRPDDRTSLIRFVSRDKIDILLDFTNNRQDLFDALENMYIEGGQTAIIDAVYLAVERANQIAAKSKSEDRTRRAIVLITDGEDRASYYNEKQLEDLLKESDVQIFVIGFVNDLSSERGFITKSPQAKAKSFLQNLATVTGGKAYFPNDVSELQQIAKDISSELRTQYSIGYIPSNERKDGSFRNIKVVVADGPKGEKRIAITKVGRVAGN
ncbi:MAG TPA: VWA domain-containing protein [Pyrinomonadaceae bacterium]|nr:VWA domain-containing protein [Pyrinomonadaceae bacterium]